MASKSRSPKWTKEEIFLALELYFRLNPSDMHARNQEVIRVSKTLADLPIHPKETRALTFRNANGVSMKLANFKAWDPTYKGSGSKNGQKLAEDLFNEYFSNRDKLKKIVESLDFLSTDNETKEAIDDFTDDSIESSSVKEGKLLLKWHQYRERKSSYLARKLKDKRIAEYGKLECEACGFDFNKKYGAKGEGFMEAHHIRPLAEQKGEVTTTIDDLALLCANCHRMIHLQEDVSDIKSFKAIIRPH